MKKLLFLSIVALIGASTIYSCKKLDGIAKLKKSCLYSSKNDFFKKWSNTYTEIDTYSDSGKIQNKQLVYPQGYFKMNLDLSYNVLSDGVVLNGTWDVNDSCQVVLDANTNLERTFDVVAINNDSLVIKRKDKNIVYIQHYKSFNTCPTAQQLETTWDNVFTRYDYYDSRDTLISRSFVYPVGYFKINADSTYHVISDSDDRTGTWLYDNVGCRITLDKNTSIERTFDILGFYNNGLAIWRKDDVAHIGYTQVYIKGSVDPR